MAARAGVGVSAVAVRVELGGPAGIAAATGAAISSFAFGSSSFAFGSSSFAFGSLMMSVPPGGVGNASERTVSAVGVAAGCAGDCEPTPPIGVRFRIWGARAGSGCAVSGVSTRAYRAGGAYPCASWLTGASVERPGVHGRQGSVTSIGVLAGTSRAAFLFERRRSGAERLCATAPRPGRGRHACRVALAGVGRCDAMLKRSRAPRWTRAGRAGCCRVKAVVRAHLGIACRLELGSAGTRPPRRRWSDDPALRMRLGLRRET